MKAFVLCAGLGTRLRPLTNHIPKPLIPVLNIPTLFYTFFLLKQAGITEIICNTHHHADTIKDFITSCDLPGLHITFSEEQTILGTGGGLKKCEHLLNDDDFILVNSDIITDIDFRALMEQHQKGGCPGTLTLYESAEAATIGCIGVENNLVKEFRNIRNTGLLSSLIYTGAAIFSPKIFSFLKPECSGIVETGFIGLVDHGGLSYYKHKGIWMDIGTMPNYWQANLDKSSIIAGMGEKMNPVIGMQPHSIAQDAFISPEAEVSGSVIGKGCRIGDGCTIRNSVLLPGVEIKAGTTIINAVMDPFSTTILKEPEQNRSHTW